MSRTRDRPRHRLGVTDIALDELHRRIEREGPAGAAMHLLDQAIEHADSVTPRQQRNRKMPAYKARSTGNQSQFLHICATTPVLTENVQI